MSSTTIAFAIQSVLISALGWMVLDQQEDIRYLTMDVRALERWAVRKVNEDAKRSTNEH